MSVWERVLAEAGFAAADDPIGADGAWTDRGLDDSVAIADLFAAATVGLQLASDDVEPAAAPITEELASDDAAEQLAGDGLDLDDDLDTDDIAGGVRTRAVVDGEEPTQRTAVDETVDQPVESEDVQPAGIDVDALSDRAGDVVDISPATLELGLTDGSPPGLDDVAFDALPLEDEGTDE